jgi:hypothetical protein
VPARRRLVLREGDFAFDTKNVGATIAASAGRVVADGVLEAGSAVDLIPAVSPARSVSVIGSSARGTLLFSAMGIGDDDAVTDAHVITTNGPTTFGPLVTALAPDTPILAAAGGDAPGTAALTIGSSTAFLAIGSRWQVKTPDGSVEWAVATGAPPSRHLVAVIGPPASVAALHLLVANVDDVPAIVDVEVLTETGPIEVSALQDVVVPGGGTSSLRVRGVPATATVGLVIRSSRGRIVAAVEAVTSRPGPSAYAIIGVPAVVSPEVAVVADPRQGVPGP